MHDHPKKGIIASAIGQIIKVLIECNKLVITQSLMPNEYIGSVHSDVKPEGHTIHVALVPV